MSYKKGKDIKQQGDCLVYCYTRRIEVICGYEEHGNNIWLNNENKPEGFEKW